MSTNPTDFHAEYCRLIESFDSTVLSIIRHNLLNAQTDSERQKWKKNMDDSLDERLRLMKIRDSFKTSQS